MKQIYCYFNKKININLIYKNKIILKSIILGAIQYTYEKQKFDYYILGLVKCVWDKNTIKI